ICHLLRLSLFLFQCLAYHPSLHSFPTRRSSDLDHRSFEQQAVPVQPPRDEPTRDEQYRELREQRNEVIGGAVSGSERQQQARRRSEEHTSELQSRVDLVCRLLLEKKKKTKNNRV